jgi:predicted dehydrogenase
VGSDQWLRLAEVCYLSGLEVVFVADVNQEAIISLAKDPDRVWTSSVEDKAMGMKVAIVGAGVLGWRRGQIIRATQQGQVVVVADVNEESAMRLAKELDCAWTSSVEDAVSNHHVQAVIICTPPALHAEVALRSMRAGKHVLCEKPLATNSADALHMVRVAEENGVVLKCGFNMRHYPGLVQLKRWADADELGHIIHGRCVYGRAKTVIRGSDWRAWSGVSGGGNLIDQGVHIVDLFRWYMGDFDDGCAFLSTSVWDIAPIEDNALVLLRGCSGGVAQFHVSWTEWNPRFLFEIVGTKGLARVEGLGRDYGVQTATLIRRSADKAPAKETIEVADPDVCWRDEWIEFTSAVKESRQPLGSGFDGYAAVRVIEMLYRTSNSSSLDRVPVKS